MKTKLNFIKRKYFLQKKKFIIGILSITAFGFFLNSCSVEDLSNPDHSTAKTMLDFEFTKSLNPNLEADISCQMNGNNIVLNVPYETDITTLKPTLTFFGGTVSPESGIPQDFSKPVTYTVTAQDGSITVYNISVKPATSTSKDITSFEFRNENNPNIGPGSMTGSIEGTKIALLVPKNMDIKSLIPTITHTGSTVSPENKVARDFSETQTYTVTAEDGTTKVYSIYVIVEKLALDSSKAIFNFDFKAELNPKVLKEDITGTVSDSSIVIEVPMGTDIANLTPSINYIGLSISPDNEVSQDFTKPVTYRVTAGDDSTRDYTVTVTVKSISIYVAGVVKSRGLARFWKNGVATDLNKEGIYANASCIEVVGEDVYIGGTEGDGGHYTAKIWKNGESIDLTNGNGFASVTSIQVINGVVYAGGYENDGQYNIAKIWINGNAKTLSNSGHNALVSEIQVVGNDIYAAGYEYNGSHNVAKLWKNGESIDLTNGAQEAYVTGLQVIDSNTYVIGYEYNGTTYIPKMWKNNESITLTNESNIYFQDIKVVENNIYIIGNYYNGDRSIVVLWKNGELTKISNGEHNANATGLKIFKGEVYVTGYEHKESAAVAKVWLPNGESIDLSDGKDDEIGFAIDIQ